MRDTFMVGLQAFQAANPTLVEHVHRARPASLTDRRTIFIGGIEEAITLDAGTWRRIVNVTLVCTRTLGENTEVTDDLEDTADALIDYLADVDNAHLSGSHTEQHPIRSATIEVSDGGTFLPAVAVVCQATIQQGRT